MKIYILLIYDGTILLYLHSIGDYFYHCHLFRPDGSGDGYYEDHSDYIRLGARAIARVFLVHV